MIKKKFRDDMTAVILRGDGCDGRDVRDDYHDRDDRNDHNVCNVMTYAAMFVIAFMTAAFAQNAVTTNISATNTVTPNTVTTNVVTTNAVDTNIIDTTVITEDPAETFTRRFGIEAADSLEIRIRRDYALCTGDTTTVTRAQLMRWNARIDSIVTRGNYQELLRSFIAATGVKPFDVRPCEPIIFAERISRNINEMDSLITAQRLSRETAAEDSARAARELAALPRTPADILNIPAGMSRRSVRTLLNRNNIHTSNMPNHLQADNIKFAGLVVTIAFHFDERDKYTGYEVETDALRADSLDTTVRGWARELQTAFERRLGAPSSIRRVSATDIRQGRLAILSRWERGANTPQTFIGLASHNGLYYAKAVVRY